MKGFIGLTTKEKEDILKQHVKPYDGYAVGNVNTNMYPLTVYDAARDKGGITVDNNGNPGTYRNHNINEIAAKPLNYDSIEEPYEFDSQGPGDPNLGYDVYNGTLPSYDFDSKGPVDVYEDDEIESEEFEDFYFDDLIDDDENLQSKRDQIEESVKKTLDVFKKFKNYN